MRRAAFFLLCTTSLGLAIAAPACAEEGERGNGAQNTALSLESLYAAGRYDAVLSEADALESADSLALAARAVLASAICDERDPPAATLRQAEAYARAALQLDPDHIEGRLQLAISLSLQARAMSLGEARASGYGELTRDLVEGVLADDPTNPYAHSFMAIWHIEVRRRGGGLGAAIMGASLEKAEWHYEQAAFHAPDEAAIHWQYARALTALNPDKYRETISLALLRANQCEDNTAAEAVMRARAADLADRRTRMKRRDLRQWAEARL